MTKKSSRYVVRKAAVTQPAEMTDDQLRDAYFRAAMGANSLPEPERTERWAWHDKLEAEMHRRGLN